MMLFVALTPCFMACEEDNDDLWAAIDDLKDRVAALETEVEKVNGNVKALQELYNGTTINKVEKQGDKYVITLSNGETIELAQGSKAEAVIPIIGISDEGMWQYSVDNGETWKSLNVKATANDGKTPLFRIDAETGYWQVSYNGQEWTNILDTNNQPVLAVGTGTVTDTFFEDVKVEGDEFVVLMKGATQPIRIPIKPDFLCKITTPTAGVQMFDLSQTKRFAVEILGVEETVLTAPEGWMVELTEAVENAAQLIVTAPAVETRATADNSKDVAVLAVAKGFATIAKIQVDLNSVAPVAPTISVAPSTTVEATQTTLTFDVTVNDADAWKYLVLPATEAAPTAETILSTGVEGSAVSVTVDGLTADTQYTFYAVATSTVGQSEVASASARTAAAPVATEVDFYQDYLDGKDVKLGSLTINKTTYPAAKLLKASELDKAVFDEGGLVFVDNTTADVAEIEPTMTSMNCGVKADMVLVGRYKERAQVTLSIPELRCNRNITVANLAFSMRKAYVFTDANAKISPSVQILDCTIDMGTTEGKDAGRYVIYDGNPKASFVDVTIDNSIICYNPHAQQPALLSNSTAFKTVAYEIRDVKVNNCVIYCPSPVKAHIVNTGNKAEFATNNLTFTITNNTTYNIYQPNVLVRAGIGKGAVVERNVIYANYTGVAGKDRASSYLLCIYDATNDAGISSVANNYLFAKDDAAPNVSTLLWKLVHGNNAVTVKDSDPATTSSVIVDGSLHADKDPFSTIDVAKGRFVLNKTNVTADWGASYETKLWLK